MALTAQPWSPTPHEGGGVADFLPQRLSLDGREVSSQPVGASQLEGLYTAFSQSLQMSGAAWLVLDILYCCCGICG